MNVLQIAKLELANKRNVFVASSIVGGLLLAAPLVPGVEGAKPQDVQTIASLAVGGAFMFLAALIQGVTMLAWDLKEQRLGFFFDLPLSSGALWGGKLLGSTLLIAGVGALTTAPSLIAVGISGAGGSYELLADSGKCLGTSVLAMLVVHALTITALARTGWVLCVVALVSFWLWSMWLGVIRLIMYSPHGSPSTWLYAYLGSLGLVLGFSGWFQLAEGRTDLRRSARMMAVAMSIGTMVSISVIHGFVLKTSSVNPSDLSRIWGGNAPCRGDWVALWGTVLKDERVGCLLLNTRSGKSLATDRKAGAVTFSEDGRRAVWIRHTPDLKGFRQDLVWADLTQSQPSIRPAQILADDFASDEVMVSKDGSRVACITKGGDLKIFTLETGSLLASTRLDMADSRNGFFLSNDQLRLYNGNGDQIKIVEFDLRTLKVNTTGCLAYVKPWGWPDYAPATDRLLVLDKTGDILFCDGRSGSILAKFAPRQKGLRHSLGFLGNGTLVMCELVEGRPALKLLDDQGKVVRTIDLSKWQLAGNKLTSGTLVSQVDSSRVRVDFWSRGNNIPRALSLLVDLDSGTAKPLPVDEPLRFSGASFGTPNCIEANGRVFWKQNRLVRLEEDGSEQAVVAFKSPTQYGYGD